MSLFAYMDAPFDNLDSNIYVMCVENTNKTYSCLPGFLSA